MGQCPFLAPPQSPKGRRPVGELIVFAVVAGACIGAATYLAVKEHPWMAFFVLTCIPPTYHRAVTLDECPVPVEAVLRP